MKYLITNADDYGYRPDISKAIVDAHKNGCLTSTTVLINAVSEEDIALAKSTPSLGFGLHLNVTSGEPLTENWKKKYGSFSRPFRGTPNQFDREVWLPFFDTYATEDIFAEYDAQVQAFTQLFGFSPTHIDSHHYSSSYKSTFPAYVQIAKKYGLPARRPKMWDVAQNQHPLGNITHVTLREQELVNAGVKTTSFFSVKYFNRFGNYLSEFEAELDQVTDGESIELSFHPGTEEGWRRKDLEILKDPNIRELIVRKGITLVHYKKI